MTQDAAVLKMEVRLSKDARRRSEVKLSAAKVPMLDGKAVDDTPTNVLDLLCSSRKNYTIVISRSEAEAIGSTRLAEGRCLK